MAKLILNAMNMLTYNTKRRGWLNVKMCKFRPRLKCGFADRRMGKMQMLMRAKVYPVPNPNSDP